MRVLSVILLIIVGMLLMFVILTKCYVEIPTTAETIDSLMVRTIRDVRGYRYALDSLQRVGVVPIMIPARVDTVEVYHTTYEIPVIPYFFRDSIPITINSERAYVPFNLMIDGYVSEYSIETIKREFYTGTVKRRADWKAIGITGGAVILGVFIIMLLK